ncbi:MAG: amino acid ABC transporter substrate-binding protein [Candidatus Bathyarchaeia archaeon]|nr:amino acid ABC transporter substrate-binding protein [Candidatus Bathyarchaeota archaeon]
MSEEKKVSRRSWMKYAGAGVVVVAAAAGAGYYATQPKPTPTPTPTTPTPTPTTPTPSPSGKKLKVRIGGTKPLTGTVALAGIDEYNALKLWAEKWVNAQGGIKGGDGNIYEVELIIYNDESKPENVSRLYEKLITEDKVDFLMGPVWAPLGMATVAAVEKYKKLELFGTATFDPELYKDWKYIVHVCTNGSDYIDNIMDMILAECVPKDPEAKNIAVIHGDALFEKVCGVWGAEAVKKRANLVFYEKYTSPPTDLTPVLTRVKAAKPAIILAGEASGATLMTKQARELGLDLKLFFPGTFAVYQDFYNALGKYAEEIIANTQWEPGIKYPPTYGPDHDWFVSNYEKEFKQSPTYHGAIGFAQGLALQAAMEKSKNPLSSDAVREALNTVEFTGFHGKFKIDPKTGWQIGHKLAVVQWQDGKKVCVWPPQVAAGKLRYPMKKWAER